MHRFILLGAVVAALTACSEPQTKSASESQAQAGAPATPGAYAAFFEERWKAAGTPITPAEVGALVEAQGAASAVQALAADGASPNRWEFVTRSMASGDAAWLAMAPVVGPGVENATAGELQAALQDALTQNPAAVLPLAQKLPILGGDVGGVCIEGGMETPAEQSQAFFTDAIAAVSKVNDPGLASLKDACLASLRQGASGAGAAL